MHCRQASSAAAAALLALWLFGTGPVASLDSNHFSVGGIRIGMTTAEVVRALHELGYDAVTVTKSRCASELVALHARAVRLSSPVGSCVASVRTAQNGDWILVGFEEDLPKNPGASVVTGVSMTFSPRTRNKSLVAMLPRELGPPSVTDGQHPWNVALWCGAFRCSSTNINYSDPNLGPLVVVGPGASASLTDNRYAEQRRSALYRVLAQHHIRIDD
jgi:hypothetical protein